MNQCPRCSRNIKDGDKYCKFCGQALMDKNFICPICGEPLTIFMQTCPGCGHEIDELLPLAKCSKKPIAKHKFKHRKKLIFIILIVFFIIMSAGFFIYKLNLANEYYLAQSTKCIENLNENNKLLTELFLKKNLAEEDKETLQPKITAAKENIEALNNDFRTETVPHKYVVVNNRIKKLLLAELTILKEAENITQLSPTQGIGKNITNMQNRLNDFKDLSAQINLNGKTIEVDENFYCIASNLEEWNTSLNLAYKTKAESINRQAIFFDRMDQYIKDYELTKDRLPDIMQNLRKGGYTWEEYFSELDTALAYRKTIQNDVAQLDCIDVDIPIQENFIEVITTSISYVQTAREAAIIEFENNSYARAMPYYDTADTIHQTETDSYDIFIQQYNNAKINFNAVKAAFTNNST